MALEQNWRWFGPQDPVTLAEIKQTGAVGIVTALHHIPGGAVWPIAEILTRKKMIEAQGLKWSVVESLPVHEDIKKRKNDYRRYVDNYRQSLRNLAQCGIDTVCYNFMPVLDWSRTDLRVAAADGAITTRFEATVMAAFDLFILQRPAAGQDYSSEQSAAAKRYYNGLTQEQKDKLVQTVLLGFPGSLEEYTLAEFKSALQEYSRLDAAELRHNLLTFIGEIMPAAEESGLYLAIHPDDPPWPLLGLPRIVSNKDDLAQILNSVDSPANGLTFCTGSLGASTGNNLVDLAGSFAQRINFIHLRNLTRNTAGDFTESYHLAGDLDIYGVMKVLLQEQKRRISAGRTDFRMPMRPDHGLLTLADQHKKGIYPGYSLFGRMRGLAELRGLELGIMRSFNL